ncbi:MAG TPA: hypothetical protein VE990_12830 [Acidimicrobiales bacterium]|nr:hypothetical protein [Acidimicrobiales bacterium]
MSVPVDLSALEAELTRFGSTPYLITVGDDGRPHAVSVHIGRHRAGLALRAGRTSVANAAARPDVALLWPPFEPGGFSLIVDGRASAGDDGTVLVEPTRSVLHRSASAPEEPAASECVTVLPQASPS